MKKNQNLRKFCNQFEENSLDEYEKVYFCLTLFILTKSKNKNDFFYPFLKSFPKNFNEYPLFYNREELNLLKNSVFFNNLLNIKKEKKRDFLLLNKNFWKVMEDYSYEDFLKADIIANSRIVSTKIKGIENLLIVPIVDMFRHNFDNNAHWRYNEEINSFEIFALKNIIKGEEIYLSYGKKSNNNFLLYYGITIDNNKSGSVEVIVKNYLDDEILKIIKNSHAEIKLFNFRIDIEGTLVFNSFNKYREILSISLNNPIPNQNFYKPISLENEVKTIIKIQFVLKSIFSKYSSRAEVYT